MKRMHFGFLAIALLTVSCAAPTSSGDGSPTTASPTTASPTTASPTTPTAVSQSTPSADAASVVKSGTFRAGEHPTSGTVQLVSQNGQYAIVLGEDFKTSEMGPDLVVILHRTADVLGSTRPPAYPLAEGSYVVLAPLQQFQGSQQYTIPSTVNVSDYASAAIWCRKFNATFGAASLQ